MGSRLFDLRTSLVCSVMSLSFVACGGSEFSAGTSAGGGGSGGGSAGDTAVGGSEQGGTSSGGAS
ncbi:MAG TPA: VWA domain-containing protein, partial [Polyangiaceae bacterium]|nr:VWA domain-containing protein [Polyangiaceae bacterium]